MKPWSVGNRRPRRRPWPDGRNPVLENIIRKTAHSHKPVLSPLLPVCLSTAGPRSSELLSAEGLMFLNNAPVCYHCAFRKGMKEDCYEDGVQFLLGMIVGAVASGSSHWRSSVEYTQVLQARVRGCSNGIREASALNPGAPPCASIQGILLSEPDNSARQTFA